MPAWLIFSDQHDISDLRVGMSQVQSAFVSQRSQCQHHHWHGGTEGPAENKGKMLPGCGGALLYPDAQRLLSGLPQVAEEPGTRGWGTETKSSSFYPSSIVHTWLCAEKRYHGQNLIQSSKRLWEGCVSFSQMRKEKLRGAHLLAQDHTASM